MRVRSNLDGSTEWSSPESSGEEERHPAPGVESPPAERRSEPSERTNDRYTTRSGKIVKPPGEIEPLKNLSTYVML